MDQELLEATQAQVEVMKELLRTCDDEFYRLNANHVRKTYEAFRNVGFSSEVAVDLVKANLMSSKSG